VFLGSGRSLGREIAAAAQADRADRLEGLFADRRLAVIDDLEGLGGPDRQQAFVQLFDAATVRGCRFCVSLRGHPARAGFEPQLASRLCAGLVLFTAGPTTPSRRAAGGREPSLGRIIRVVATRRELAVSDLVGPSRRHTVAAARALAMHLARDLTSKSLDEIGAAFGGRDHTTVMHALKVVSGRLLHDSGLASDIDRCRARLAGPIVDLARGRRRRVDSTSARLPPGA
jgi:chromosomal replication initiation ATPase DnaA